MSAILDRRENAIRTRHRPATPGAPFIPDLEKAAAGGVATLDETAALIPTSQLGTGTATGSKALMGDRTWTAVATPADVAAEAALRSAADASEAAARAAADALLQPLSGKNAANGYPGLDASSKLTGSQQKYGTAANTACEGNDARLSDSRAPTGVAGGDLSGAYPSPTVANLAITDAKVAAANKDGAAATASMRTLGTGAAQACAGNDSRLSNSRTPTAHASSHAPDGSDPISTYGTFTPSFTNLTVVNGTGGATYNGYWFKVGKLVYVLIEILVTGTCTTASTANSTRVTNLPFTVTRRGAASAGDSNVTDLGQGLFYSGTTAWVSTWSARNVPVWISGTYYTDD